MKFAISAMPVHGGYSQWSTWDSCSKLCGGGTQQRSRSCTSPRPRNKGRDCSGLGARKQTRTCNIQTCTGKLLFFFRAPKILQKSTNKTQERAEKDWCFIYHVQMFLTSFCYSGDVLLQFQECRFTEDTHNGARGTRVASYVEVELSSVLVLVPVPYRLMEAEIAAD